MEMPAVFSSLKYDAKHLKIGHFAPEVVSENFSKSRNFRRNGPHWRPPVQKVLLVLAPRPIEPGARLHTETASVAACVLPKTGVVKLVVCVNARGLSGMHGYRGRCGLGRRWRTAKSKPWLSFSPVPKRSSISLVRTDVAMLPRLSLKAQRPPTCYAPTRPPLRRHGAVNVNARSPDRAAHTHGRDKSQRLED